jgi:glycosyltransferase involved in cell wall biosynthesis
VLADLRHEGDPLRLLFTKHSLAWPRSSGHDVHTYFMMKACAALGHQVALATTTEPSPAAVNGLSLSAQFLLDCPRNGCVSKPVGTWLQRRYRAFFGIPESRVVALADAAKAWKADAVIIVGLDALPYFPALSGVVRVWYAADEWAWHHISQLKLGDAEFATNLREALVKGLYERAHRRVVDHVWVVTESDRRAVRLVAGIRDVEILANGVDSDYFAPAAEVPLDRTAVFWGRLDFGPNLQALEWFCRRVWPLVRRVVSDARFTVLGFKPTDTARRLTSVEGVSLIPDLPDIRDVIRRHAVVVLPFVSGGGIKNKLLEAAALGKPIVCTRAAAQGLRSAKPPLLMVSSPAQMSRAIIDLWGDVDRQRQLGSAARSWVVEHHTWTAAAREAIQSLQNAVWKKRTSDGGKGHPERKR